MKKKHLSQFGIGILLLLVINFVANTYFFRIDLTEEGRYTIHPATKSVLKSLDDEVLIKVYLDGNFPAGFKRLQKAVEETLDEFKIYAGKNIKYRFIDPSTLGKNEQERGKAYQELVQKGIVPTNVFAKEEGNRTEKIIFPGALLYYKNFELPLMLFKTIDQRVQGAPTPEQILNQSVENVEYNLISGIQQITTKKKKRIAFTQGNGELEEREVLDLIRTLKQYYEVYLVDLPKSEIIDESLEAVIIAKPDSSFSSEDKYKLDQYVMQGGKMLMFMDVVGVYMDSVLRDKGSFTFPYEHNLLDLTFRYGVRLNSSLIQDLNCGVIPMITGNMGDQPQVRPIPWFYYPLINAYNEAHPIVKSLGPIASKFITTIDTVKAEGIRKTPLMYSSKYSRKKGTPAFVTFNEAREMMVEVQKDQKNYVRAFLGRAENPQPYPVAYLLEGAFNSMFTSRSQSQRKDFIAKSKPTKVLICSDGDIIRNEINRKTGEPVPLGLDPVFQTTYSNKDFVLNALAYMIDDQGVMLAKNKTVKIRPLDKLKLEEERRFWQILNMALPIFLVLLFGLVFFGLRRRRFGRN